MPEHAVDLLERHLGGLAGKKVAVLGLAFRSGIRIADHSGALELVRILRQRCAIALVHDPFWGDEELVALGLNPYRLGSSVDAAIVQTEHEAYGSLTAADLPSAQVVVDGRGITSSGGWGSVRRLVLGVGDPARPIDEERA
jgi:UDP-N-acetyl-D-mannosaminuronate dehydrogenase